MRRLRPPVTFAGTQQIDLVSEVDGHPYQLYIAPPDGYAVGDTTPYPVLYLLDGRLAFPAAYAARASMDICDGQWRFLALHMHRHAGS